MKQMRKKVTALSFIFTFLVTVVSAQAPAVRWGPVYGLITPETASIKWATTIPAACSVKIDGIGLVRQTPKGIYHSVSLTKLKPKSKYSFQISMTARQGQTKSGPHFFTTPQPSKNWAFVVFGDTRTNLNDHKKVVNGIINYKDQFAFSLHTGDLTENGEETKLWDLFFSAEAPLLSRMPFLPCRGNHEGKSFAFFHLFYTPLSQPNEPHSWYSFRYNNAIFVILDPLDDMKKQATFLDEVLARAQLDGVKWKFVAFHNPPYSSGKHGNDQSIIETWVPILEKYRVTCGFFGHDHLYEHSLKSGVHYMISGGGGAPLYQQKQGQNPYSLKVVSTLHFAGVTISEKKVEIKVVAPDGSIVDTVEITE